MELSSNRVNEPGGASSKAIASLAFQRLTTLTGVQSAALVRPQLSGRDDFALRMSWQGLKQPKSPDYWGEIVPVDGPPDGPATVGRTCLQFVVRRGQPQADQFEPSRPAKVGSNISGIVDQTVSVLAGLLADYAKSPNREVSALLAQIAAALRWHVINRYADLDPHSDRHRGGLAPWQLQRATALMEQHLGQELRLNDVAQACRLSTSHFARAFRQTTGKPPHRWLVERKVNKARELMESTTHALSAVAQMCGFNDQSHFTRVFTTEMGLSPGRWRRLREAAKAMSR